MGQRIARVRVALSGWAGGPGLETFYFRPETALEVPTESMALTCANGVRAAFFNLDNFWPAFIVATVNPVVDVIDCANGQLDSSYSVTPPAVVHGTEGGVAGPSPAMLCVNWLTADIIKGHRVRGRSFLGPLKSASDADGSPTTAQLTQCNEFGDDLELSPLHHVVWHRPKGGEGGAACDVTAHVTNDRFAILRSRRA